MKSFVAAIGLFALSQHAAAQSACLSITSQFQPCVYSCVSSAASAVGCTNTADLSCSSPPPLLHSLPPGRHYDL